MEEDRAARRLEVDEHGIARRTSNDIWSNATSRRTSAATTLAALSDEEDNGAEPSGDLLWEDERHAAVASRLQSPIWQDIRLKNFYPGT